MKAQFLIIFLTLSSILFAGNADKSWVITIHDESFSPSHMYPTWDSYYLEALGDTLIESKSYYKLLKSDSLEGNWYSIGALRIDSNKVYIRNNGLNDLLLYDLP